MSHHEGHGKRAARRSYERAGAWLGTPRQQARCIKSGWANFGDLILARIQRWNVRTDPHNGFLYHVRSNASVTPLPVINVKTDSYRLIGVVCHEGNQGGGHYWTYIADFEHGPSSAPLYHKYDDLHHEVGNIPTLPDDGYTRSYMLMHERIA